MPDNFAARGRFGDDGRRRAGRDSRRFIAVLRGGAGRALAVAASAPLLPLEIVPVGAGGHDGDLQLSAAAHDFDLDRAVRRLVGEIEAAFLRRDCRANRAA